MTRNNFFSIFAGLTGFSIGLLVGFSVFTNEENSTYMKMKLQQKLSSLISYKVQHNTVLADKLYNEVKILCMVMTYPANHDSKAVHVKKTWGRRCNKLLFMTSASHSELETVVLDGNDTREELWNKTKKGFMHLYDHYLNDFDYFLKADDDNYIVVENLRYMLSQYNPKTALYFGHRFARSPDEGYMAGGGYILSQKALSKFGDKLIYNHTLCREKCGAEDVGMGHCLAHSAIFVDCRDEMHQKRFFPIDMTEHAAKPLTKTYDWYANTLYYNVTEQSLGCCSDTSVGFHYQGPKLIHLLEYYIYTVDIFGLDTYNNETLPPKLSLQEIITASDYQSLAKNYMNHTDYHDLESSEKYLK